MRSFVFRFGFVGVIAAFGVLVSCRRAEPVGVYCTEVFVVKTIFVREPNGTPVPDATIKTTLVRTGQTLEPHSLGLYLPGHYPIVDDGARTVIRQGGDDVRVTGTSTKGGFTANYVFNVPGGCHINKVSGPDTVTVQP